MDLHETIRAWASSVIAAGSLLYAIFTGRGKAAKEEQGKLEARIKAVEDGQIASDARLAQMELTIKHLPTREQFHGIELSFATMAGDMKGLSSTMSRVERLLDRERPSHGA